MLGVGTVRCAGVISGGGALVELACTGGISELAVAAETASWVPAVMSTTKFLSSSSLIFLMSAATSFSAVLSSIAAFFRSFLVTVDFLRGCILWCCLRVRCIGWL